MLGVALSEVGAALGVGLGGTLWAVPGALSGAVPPAHREGGRMAVRGTSGGAMSEKVLVTAGVPGGGMMARAQGGGMMATASVGTGTEVIVSPTTKLFAGK